MAEERLEIESKQSEADENRIQTHWSDEILGRQFCAACGAPRTGDYCADCGQKFVLKRLSLWELLGELFSRVTDLERGLLFTIIAMFKRPGEVCRDYVSGKQKPYINPLTYFFIGAAVQILMYWSIQGQLRDQLTEQFVGQLPPGVENGGELEQLLGQPPVDVLVESYTSAVLQGYTYVSLFSFVLPFAFWLCLFHSAMGTRFRVGETMVYALFTFGQILILTAVFGFFTFRLGPNVHMAMAIAVYTLVSQAAHTKFFASSWPARLLTFVATALSVFSLMLGIGGMLLLTIAFRVFWAMQAAG
ncbi:MAG: DUF3667 domain-containing protein [Aureliella sp.]